jgi:hypothetical protein
VWSGHSCPLLLTVILLLTSTLPPPKAAGRADREGHEFHSCHGRLQRRFPDVARVEQTLLSAAFDVDPAFDFDLASARGRREGKIGKGTSSTRAISQPKRMRLSAAEVCRFFIETVAAEPDQVNSVRCAGNASVPMA